MRKGLKLLTFVLKNNKLMHLKNTWIKPSFNYDRNNINDNSINAQEKFNTLYVMFFSHEQTRDNAVAGIVYRFYIYYD